MNHLIRITLNSLKDQFRQKSFFIMLGISILFVLTIRGCYDGNYVANGQTVDAVTVAWNASKIAFHIIAFGSSLFAIMLSMSVFSKDKENGMICLYLSKPVTRVAYVLGRIGGVWIHAFLFMFILHGTIFLLVWNKTGGMISGYLSASLVCAISLLFFILFVCLFSLIMPDIIAALTATFIGVLSFISDSAFKIMHTGFVQQIVQSEAQTDIPLWRILMPKISMLQYYADSLIGEDAFQGMGIIHPLFNVGIYIGIGLIAIIMLFDRKEL